MKLAKRRQREYKTDYKKRFGLLKSGNSRIVFRKTNKYLNAQYVTSKEAQDKVAFGIDSRNLIDYGWPESSKGSLKSVTASYLTGYLMGKKILSLKLETPIIDLGMIRTIHKSKVYGFIKGIIDSGVKINCKRETFPDESRIKGEHMKNKIQFDKIKNKIDEK